MIASPVPVTNVLQGLAASPHAAGKKVVAGDFLQIIANLKQAAPAVGKVAARPSDAKASKDEPKKSAAQPTTDAPVAPTAKSDDASVPVVPPLAPPLVPDQPPVVVAPLVLLPLPVPEHAAPTAAKVDAKPDVVEPEVQLKAKPSVAAKLATPTAAAPVLTPAPTPAPVTAPETRQQSTSQRKPENPAPPPAAASKTAAPAAATPKADAPVAPTPTPTAAIPAPVAATPEILAPIATPAPAANHAVAAILATTPSLTHDAAPPSIDTAAPAPRPAPVEPPAMVESARLIQTAAGSEMHIGLRSEALGQVSVHAVVHNQSVGATIAVQDHETHELFTRDLPALQSHLQERNIHLDEIAVIPQSLSAGSGLQQQQQQQTAPQRRQPQVYKTPESKSAREIDSPVWTADNGRLSIRA